MDDSEDLIDRLGQDISMMILMCLEDPSDLVHASAVSSSWRQFVIANGLFKKLCLRMFPEALNFTCVVEFNNAVERLTEVGNSSWAHLQTEHRAYSRLCRELTDFVRESCVSAALYASSTDNYPDESIKNTLESSDRFGRRASYWSSKGTSNPGDPETLIFKLGSRLSLISEVHIHPFQAYFQFSLPIYSARAVRFQLGYPKAPLDVENVDEYDLDDKDFTDDKFVWAYTSPEFPMVQENCLQKFELPKPVLCIGGILKVELLGRVQTQEMDGLYYICITHVQVVGKLLSPVFDIKAMNEQGKCLLKYSPVSSLIPCPLEVSAESNSRSQLNRLSESIRAWEQMILNTFRGAGPLIIDEYNSDSE